jgi:hypothetical protein
MPIPPAKLVALASGDRVSTVQLVRFCKLAASLLGDGEMVNWCADELAGYDQKRLTAEHPYRAAAAELRATDVWGRTVPVGIPPGKPHITRKLTTIPLPQPISEIEDAVAHASADAHFKAAFPPEYEDQLRKATPGTTEVFRLFQVGAFRNVLSAVRQRVADWAHDLAAQGLMLPDEAAFDAFFGIQPEPAAPDPAAMKSAATTIMTFTGDNYGVVQAGGDQAQQTATVRGIDPGVAGKLVEGLLGLVQQHERTDQRVAAELRGELENLRAALAAPHPKQAWLREGLRSVRNILESAVGSALYEAAKAAGFVAAVGQLLGT